MAENDRVKDPVTQYMLDKLYKNAYGDNSSSPDSDGKKGSKYHIFGREKTLHEVLGGGKQISGKNEFGASGEVLDNSVADIFLWRNKKISAGVLGFATAIWMLFELLEYHLLTLACHILILALVVVFLWSYASTFINKSPPKFPEAVLPEDIVLGVDAALRIVINGALAILNIAARKDLKKFLGVIAGLCFFSILGSRWNFLTIFYISLVLLLTFPVLYEKYKDKIDNFAEKAEAEIKKLYAVFNVKVLSKIPKWTSKDKKVL